MALSNGPMSARIYSPTVYLYFFDTTFYPNLPVLLIVNDIFVVNSIVILSELEVHN